jgi:hypothetical protein
LGHSILTADVPASLTGTVARLEASCLVTRIVEIYGTVHSGSDVSSQKGVSIRPNICICQCQEANVRWVRSVRTNIMMLFVLSKTPKGTIPSSSRSIFHNPGFGQAFSTINNGCCFSMFTPP